MRRSVKPAVMAGKNAVVTIISRNYLGMGLAVAESVLSHHPEVDAFVYVMDDRDGASRSDVEAAGARFLSPAGVDIPGAEGIYRRYDVTEACTTVKPHVMLHLFRMGYETVCYMDPDLWVLSPMKELFSMLRTSKIVLTPHIVTPIDGGSPFDEKWLMHCGVYNLGFIGVRHEVAEDLCSWWGRRLESAGYCAPAEGMFFDQKWIDAVPGFFDDVGILKHRGYNVAWWNLHERTIEKHGNDFLVAETAEPLRFFHFSQFPSDAADPRLSRNIAPHRLTSAWNVQESPGLSELVRRYRACLFHHRHHERKSIPYGYQHLTRPRWRGPRKRLRDFTRDLWVSLLRVGEHRG